MVAGLARPTVLPEVQEGHAGAGVDAGVIRLVLQVLAEVLDGVVVLAQVVGDHAQVVAGDVTVALVLAQPEEELLGLLVPGRLQARQPQVAQQGRAEVLGRAPLEGLDQVVLSALHQALGLGELPGPLAEHPTEVEVGLPGLRCEATGVLQMPQGQVSVPLASVQGPQRQVQIGALVVQARGLVQVGVGGVGPSHADQRGPRRDEGGQVRRVLGQHLARLRQGLVAPGLASAVVEPAGQVGASELVPALGVVRRLSDLCFETAGMPVELLVGEHCVLGDYEEPERPLGGKRILA